MNANLNFRGARLLGTAALLIAAAAAQAAPGYTVSPGGEALVRVGMTRDDVRAAIGRPASVERFGNQSGPTWTYDVSHGSYEAASFNVDFDAHGTVTSVEELPVIEDRQ